MTTIVNLPDNNTATLRDKSDLTNREAKKLTKIQFTAAGAVQGLKDYGFNQEDPKTWSAMVNLTAEQLDQLDEYQRTCVKLRLLSWTLDRPIPQTADEVDDLPRSIYEPLTIAASDVKFGDDEDEFEINPDPKAPTPSSDV